MNTAEVRPPKSGRKYIDDPEDEEKYMDYSMDHVARVHAARKAEPKRDMAEIKQQVAEQFDLPYVDGVIQIPDSRIEYDLERKGDQEMDRGSGSSHDDIEVLTAAYRPGHLRAKAQAGFHVYASASDRATLTAKIEKDHRLMENILEM